MKHRVLSLLLAAFILTSCGNGTDINNIIDREEPGQEPPPEKTGIVIAATGMRGEFSPFYTGFNADSGDADVMRVIGAPLVTLDRRGAVVRSAGTGETRDFDGTEYNYRGIADVEVRVGEESTVLNFLLRNDVFFSDGENLDADDLIFTLYAFCDNDYKGGSDIGALPIEGLEQYKTDADNATYERYRRLADGLLEAVRAVKALEAAGELGDIYSFDEIAWSDLGLDLDFEINPAQYDLFHNCYREAWLSHVYSIIEYSAQNYAEYAELISSEARLDEDMWLRAALAMLVWRVADFSVISPATEDEEPRYGPFTSFVSGREWDLIDNFPTAEDLYGEFYALYGGDLEAYIRREKIGIPPLDDPVSDAVRRFIAASAAADPENRGADFISGLRRAGDYEVEITLDGQTPWAVYSLTIPIAPLHYYGNEALYNYGGNSFGFTRGDISAIRGKTEPLGAGPYRLVSYDGLTAELEANEYYYKGKPLTGNVTFRETETGDAVYGVATGLTDIAAVPVTQDLAAEIDAYIDGDVMLLTDEAYDGALGYIGINAERISIGEPMSVESVNFRTGIATILAAYRDISVRGYYGEAAVLAEYPISGVSWAAPRQGDDGYKPAFGADAEGEALYAPHMTEAMRLEAAATVALDFFEAAGCELDERGTAIAAFPEGLFGEGESGFEIYVAGNGQGRHPSYLLLELAAETLREMNIKITIRDLSQAEMFEAVMNGDADMWCAAFGGEVMPRLDRYFSSGGSENFFRLSGEIADLRIALANASLDPALYRSALDAVLDSAVCVPVYQRKICFVFGEAIDGSTIEGDLTAHYGFLEIIEKLEL